MQNRGQLSAGVTTFDKDRRFLLATYKNLGTVNETFKTSNPLKSSLIFNKFKGNMGIGHVRYATCGKEDKEYAQPFVMQREIKWKWFSVAFNGNLANYKLLKQELEKKNHHLIRDTDTEVVLHSISRELLGKRVSNGKIRYIEDVLTRAIRNFDGAYNIVFANALGHIAALRDPLGIRPLCYAKTDEGIFVASESNGLVNSGLPKFKPVKPGTMITVINGEVYQTRFSRSNRKAHCMFEWVYFSNVSSVIDEKSVYVARTRLGKELAKSETLKLGPDHIVVPVPDTAKAAGDAYAYELGVPSLEGLIRNRYVGRTFIEGKARKNKVETKYTVLPEIVKGKKVILVDDSLVRGATSKEIIRYIKEVGGAKEVHLRVSCPPIRGPCFYGIDMSTLEELLVPRFENKYHGGDISKNICDKIAKYLGADSLRFQSIKGLVNAIDLSQKNLCLACINRKYPTEFGKKLFHKALENFVKSKKIGKYNAKRTYE